MKMTNRRWLGTLTAALLLPIVVAQTLPSPRYQTPTANDNSALAATTSFVRGAVQAFAGAGDWIADGAGAVKLSIKAKLLQRVNILDYGAVSDPTCSADYTSQIQAAITAGAGKQIDWPAGTWCYKNLKVTADGTRFHFDPSAVLRMTDAASNGITVGDGTNIIYDFRADGGGTLWTKPGLTKTGGSAVMLQNVRNADLRGVNIGSKKMLDVDSGIPRLYNGLTVRGFDNVNASATNIIGATNDCLQIAGGGTGPLASSAEFAWDGGGQILQCGHFGAWLAGGTGGVKFNSGGISLSIYGVWASTDLGNAINRETYFGAQFSVDSNTNDGLYAAPNSVFFLFCDGCWFASNGGSGVNLDTMPLGSVARLADPHLYSNGADGLRSKGIATVTGGTFIGNGRTGPGNGIQAAGGTMSIDGSPYINGNGVGSGTGYGIALGAGAVRLGSYNAFGNQSGDLYTSPGVMMANNVTGTPQAPAFAAANVPAAGWSIDTSMAGTSLASGSSVTLAVGSGKITLSESGTGSVAEFLVGGGNVVLTNQTAAVFATGTTPAAGKIAVGWNGSAYIVSSNYGSTISLGFAGTRLRASY